MNANRDLTRRQWAVALAAASAATAQTPAAPGSANPAQLLEEARVAVQRSREALKRFKLPIGVEPASVFRA